MELPSHWVERIQSLPVLPQVAMRITERIQSPTATLQEIAALIKSDIGLSSSILRLANSSYYSIPGGVSDVSRALQYLGFTTIAQSVLTSSFFGAFKNKGVREFPLSAFWAHSFAVGLLAELTSRSLQLKNSADAFIGGLMHDVGKVVLMEIAPDELSKIIKHAEANKISFLRAEVELRQVPHTVLGAEFGKYWNLPQTVLENIRHHHGGSTKKEDQVIEWANLHVHEMKIGSSGSFQGDTLSTDAAIVAAKLGLDANRIAMIDQHFHKEFEKAGALLNAH